ncbi:type II secretion system protein [Aquirhabdus parva]|uniref:type II secretion system protein n=1 Tax=Aquirhabdus parva TaxID=2283318 RepID=UPI001AE3418A|nr:prepilin-type N-terminal cleavage/methylation domain-containing protein [Aquirhabdus parva]
MRTKSGFTIVELLVVLSVIALLLSIVTPRYLEQVEVGKETVLRQNLATIRRVIDQYHADKGTYPATLDLLIEAHYLRSIPLDPMIPSPSATQTNAAVKPIKPAVPLNHANWQIIMQDEEGKPGIYDVKSTSQGVGRNGIPYAQW